MTSEYIERLKKRGYKPHDAARFYTFYMQYLNEDYLDAVIKQMESDGYVADVQSKSVL